MAKKGELQRTRGLHTALKVPQEWLRGFEEADRVIRLMATMEELELEGES